MGNYIVRIYYRAPRSRSLMTGILEVVESGVKLPFHSDQELWDIMATAEAGSRKKGGLKFRRLFSRKPDDDMDGK